MINEDNVCIRYLMKEMDPSEEVLMERAMMEDDDLLIEVECLRQTLKRLDELPHISPPAYLTRSIVQQAAEERQRNRNTLRFLYSSGFKYAAAACIVIGAIGSAWLYQDSADIPSEKPVTKSQLSMSREATSTGPSKLPVTPVRDNSTTTPWVDRNDVIYFHDHYRTNNTAFDSIIKSSTEKLIPLNDPFYYNTGTRSLQLTGSGASQ